MKRLSHDANDAFPFFMPASGGPRFCLFSPPSPEQSPLGSILYIHPFAEELNKSRRMASLQARAFAANGYGVLQIDLYGCGDSSGDLADARWHIWREDIQLADIWLKQRFAGTFSLWGLRLGGLLAFEFACENAIKLDRVILWHPVLRGKNYLDHFFRLYLASQMMGNKTNGSKSPRQILSNGDSVEVAGYEIPPSLAADIDALDVTTKMPSVPVHWFQIGSIGNDTIPTAIARQAQHWRSGSSALSLHMVPGIPFWAAQENLECEPLLTATTAACT